MTTQAVFIDPSSNHFLDDRLFDLNNHHLNRDGTLIPFAALRDHLAKQGIPVHTADKLRDGSARRDVNHYWSLGIINGYKSFLNDDSVRLRGFILFEPPIVQPKMYNALPQLSANFEEVFLHNVLGDGYFLDRVVKDRLKKIYWPQPYGDVQHEFWERKNRLNKLVMIAGNHNPGFRKPEYYSERINAVARLSKYNGIDLFGRGWEKWWSRQSLWWPYWRHRPDIMSSYQGACASKLEVLSKYRFSVCFENMPMKGYVTEKLFDCFYAGTVPIYWGAPDINELVPAEAYIDMRKYYNVEDMFDRVQKMSDREWINMREAARHFLRGCGATQYRDSLINVISIN